MAGRAEWLSAGLRSPLGAAVLASMLAVPLADAVLSSGSPAERKPRVRVEPITGMSLVRVEPGEFVIGSPADEPMREAQESRHAVRLTRAFELGLTEVTQAEWQRVMGTTPSAHKGCARCPVEDVSHPEIEEFLRRLDALSPLDGFRLPSEAEWEIACRAGTTTAFASGTTLGATEANVHGGWPYPGSPPGPQRGTTTPVGTFAANAWGFFDMHGNVWEWTADRHCPYPDRPVSDPVGRCASPLLVIRGGSWAFGADSARCALRYTHAPEDRGPSLGFRVAREP